PLSGVNYYRLQQEDISGNISPSNIVSATIEKRASVRLYPNPAASTVYVENVPAGSAIIVTNAAGYAVYSGTVTSSKLSIDVRNLSSGVYFLQYKTNGVKNTIEFVKR
ncbi:MAG: T9SS type A sorting domain-containing protein, partial [Chitinophagaceae bacterium]|nr:T9SS type A sorting domain-containing protein [Chitinophagaceae bacterium]